MLIPHFVILWPFPTAGGGTECFILESEAGDVLYLDLLSLWVIKLSPGKGWSGRPGQGRSRGENVEICHWGRRLSHLQTPGTGQHWGSDTSCNPFSVISRDNHAETRVKSTSSSISSLDGRIVNVPGDKLQSTPDTQHSWPLRIYRSGQPYHLLFIIITSFNQDQVVVWQQATNNLVIMYDRKFFVPFKIADTDKLLILFVCVFSVSSVISYIESHDVEFYRPNINIERWYKGDPQQMLYIYQTMLQSFLYTLRTVSLFIIRKQCIVFEKGTNQTTHLEPQDNSQFWSGWSL